jgi:hypothetical protein
MDFEELVKKVRKADANELNNLAQRVRTFANLTSNERTYISDMLIEKGKTLNPDFMVTQTAKAVTPVSSISQQLKFARGE